MQISPSDDLTAKTSSLAGVPEVPASVRLYSPRKVAVATFLGGILAGGTLLWLNYKALQQDQRANQTLIWSIAGLFLLMISGMLLDLHAWGTGISTGCAVAFSSIARSTYGSTYKAHSDQNGKLGGWWATIGICAAAILTTVGIAFLMGIVMTLALHK